MAERALSGTPGMLALYARAGAGTIPGASRLPLVGGRRRADVPDLTLVLKEVSIDRARLAAYDRVCGFTPGDLVPASYPHVLAFPLHLSLVTDPSFPFPAIGLVHISDLIIQHRPLRIGERLSVHVWATALQPHRRGRQFSLRSEFRAGEEVVWEEVSTNLRRERARIGGREAADRARTAGEELPVAATWPLPADLGRRYGAVSGDLNPIHLHPLSSRPFGFARPIAHGMWTTARCLAALGPRLPEAYTVEVAFKRPILLPATVAFASASVAGAIRFSVRDAQRRTPHLDGMVRPDQ